MAEMDSLFRSPVRRLAQHLNEGTVSARSLLDHYLARIERLNPKLNAITFLDPDAKIAETARARTVLVGAPRLRLVKPTEKPDQKQNRNGHAKKPEQKVSSHGFLLVI